MRRKKEFVAWQDEWNRRHDGCLQRKEDELRERKDREEEERRRRTAEILHEKVPEKPQPKGPQPGKIMFLRNVFQKKSHRVYLTRFSVCLFFGKWEPLAPRAMN